MHGTNVPAEARPLSGESTLVTTTVVPTNSRLHSERQHGPTQDPLTVTSYLHSAATTTWSGGVGGPERPGTLPQFPGTGVMVPTHVSD